MNKFFGGILIMFVGLVAAFAIKKAANKSNAQNDNDEYVYPGYEEVD